jgi:uncharacterized protein
VSAAHIDREHERRPAAGMASAIYEGTVRHRRFAVRSHEFRQRLALAYLDLDELPGLLGGRLLARGPGLVRFRRGDYLGDVHESLSEAVRDAAEAQTGVRPCGPIRLLANLSALGHCFNPVSFYYCMDRTGAHLDAVVAEVTNTPWGERHTYVLSGDANAGERSSDVRWPTVRSREARWPAVRSSSHGVVLGGDFDKALHVSPFMAMNHRYEWRMTAPAQTLSVHISSRREGRVAFDATLSLRRRELTRASLAKLTVTTLRTLVAIYGQAALLKLKGVPVYPHVGVDRPHVGVDRA